jgi:hypothetical protein
MSTLKDGLEHVKYILHARLYSSVHYYKLALDDILE